MLCVIENVINKRCLACFPYSVRLMDQIGLRSNLTLYSTVRMLKLCKIHTFNKIFRNVHTSAVLYMDENAFICTNLYR